MSDGFAILAGVIFLGGMGVLFYTSFRSLWQREQEYKAQRLVGRAAAGLPTLARADRVRESVGAVFTAAIILAALIYFGQGGHPGRALVIALPMVYSWRWLRAKRKAGIAAAATRKRF